MLDIKTNNISKTKSKTQPLKLLWIVLCLRSGLFLAELITGFRVHSLSLIALSGHLFVDLSAIAIAIAAAWLVEHFNRSKLPLNPQQIEAVAASVNSLILLAVATSILWGITHDVRASTPEAGLPMLAIAALGLIVKGINANLLYEDRHNLNVRGVFLHAIADGASSLGLLIAALAIFSFHWLWADTAASCLLVIFMLISAFSLLKDSLHAIER
ncbi:cation transporter [Waterburya agarophytonicola K14]|uniref:Cation transporter n=1 Tax=Waterburya agarophytonicola KI4 TaxID=2874699 RepID=A0A964BM33_9CYAN|nr:cation diffusion facilitator family transporter [Waterburya agarophytonicola]MCC0175909.1 cation transporter [Waterburya agarophytonicola KI4]